MRNCFAVKDVIQIGNRVRARVTCRLFVKGPLTTHALSESEVNRAELRMLAQARIDDARVLLANGRWSAAYYLVGYAVECGLKACILAFVERTGIIFKDKRFAEKCWTHRFGELAVQADLKNELDAAMAVHGPLAGYWGTAESWTETSRYEHKTQADAEALFEAVTDQHDGVIQWLSKHW